MKYLTAEQLKITPAERKALLAVKRFLKRIEPVKDISTKYNHDLYDVTKPAPARFNMNNEIRPYDCGTACCIGGWMSLQMQGVPLRKVVAVTKEQAEQASRYVNSDGPMGQLFYPQSTFGYDDITPAQAVKEITRFLTTGKATW